ncbi:hypothetical protein X777_08054 [Ooceraea biroi]|uniref:Uncharacterized protein n=1 Tax=Ooceraea biroi TaxID=2015173 RepID=A0A026WAA0_OOCBI|nr:hypothetical protein X777_08054 [Ooceraea biroi]
MRGSASYSYPTHSKRVASRRCNVTVPARRFSPSSISGELAGRDGRRTFFEEGRDVGGVNSSSSNSSGAGGGDGGGGGGGGDGDGEGGGSARWWWWMPKMMVGWSDGGAPSAQAVLSDADAVTGAQRDPTQLDLTSHIRSRIKRRGLGKWSACACAVVPSPSRPCLTREYREQGESDAKGWTGSARE